MAGFTTSMVSTIVISLAMVWLLTDGGQKPAPGEDGRPDRKEAMRALKDGPPPDR